MQSSGNLISAAAKLTAGMKYGENDFNGWKSRFLLNTDRYTASVVSDGNYIVLLDIDCNKVTVARESLVYCIVNYLVYKVVKPLWTCRTDIHTRAFSYSLQPLQYLYLIFVVCFRVNRCADRFNIKLTDFIVFKIIQCIVLPALLLPTVFKHCKNVALRRFIHIKILYHKENKNATFIF